MRADGDADALADAPAPGWEADVLGPPYEARTLVLGAGAVATLVRRVATRPTTGAVLYVHGFADYFFQTHMADVWLDAGFAFYALDLRDHGRSIRAGRPPNVAYDLGDYEEELDAALDVIRAEGHDRIVVSAHSTGGLVCSLWAHHRRGRGLVHAVVLNSPWFDLNLPGWAVPAVSVVVEAAGRLRPEATLPVGVGGLYGRSLHRDHQGTWDYDLNWKPLDGFGVRAGWLRAVRHAQRELARGLAIDVPVFVACAARSVRSIRWTPDVQRADAVLDADRIATLAPRLGPHVTVVRIDGGIHDLALSAHEPRSRYFDELSRWLGAYAGP